MSKIELKKNLIEKINSLENDELLKEASRLIDIELKDINTPYILSKDMHLAVKEARSQIKNGDFLSHTEANETMEKWLEE